MNSYFRPFFVIVAACQLIGCQEAPPQKLITASGTVLIDGEPLSSGTIRFVPEKGRPMNSAILGDGSFQLGSNSVADADGVDGVPPGKYQVAISSSIIEGDEGDKVRWLAPRHYADFRTSDIEIELEESTDDLLIELTWEGAEEESVDEGPEDTDPSAEQDENSAEPEDSSADEQTKEQ